MNIFFYIIILFLIQTKSAFSYIDPGSGSIILQAILFVLAGIGTFFAFFKSKVKEIFNKIFKKKDLDKNEKNDPK